MKKKEHLPLFGIGPVYMAIIVAVSLAGIGLSWLGNFPVGNIPVLRLPFLVIGVLIMLLGAYFWLAATLQSRIFQNIGNNTLVTTGVYAHVRNPIYSACMMLCTGALLLANNLWLLILPVFYWLFMTVLMKNTEEKWLRNLYGEEYLAYCSRVNRCIPWFAK